MRAAIFADQLFYKQPGGIAAYLRGLLPELAVKLEDDSLVLAHHGPEGARLFPDSRNISEASLPRRRDLTGISWHTLKKPELESYLGDLDLVHAPSLVYPPSRAPLVATVHDLIVLKYPRAFPRRWRLFHSRGLKLILREARVIIADSESTRGDLASLLQKKDPRMRVIPLGVSTPARIDKAGVEETLRGHGLKPGYVLYVGTLEPRKNLARLVESCSSMDTEIREGYGSLVLAGAAGWLGRAELSRIVSHPGVKWLGHLPREDLEAVYSGASIFAYPSLYEGFGLPVLEAMARGLPVVTSNTSSMREVGEGAALLIDPEDTGDIRRALQRLLEDGGLRDELAARGRERAAEYTWGRTAELTAGAYRDAL
ncbi:MAG: glycosyltransferase family 1 protein [Actinomycetota bacterium]|nr:glycosyltransferase family 1 protein [Actinomycetota bacterium]